MLKKCFLLHFLIVSNKSKRKLIDLRGLTLAHDIMLEYSND